MIRSTNPHLTVILGGFVAIFCCARAGAAETPSGNGTRIESCHIGFNDQFKVGFWTPIWVNVTDLPRDGQLSVEVTASDSDGVATTVSAPCSARSTLLYAMIGRVGSPIRIDLLAGAAVIDHRDLASRLLADNTHVGSMPATSELILQVGSAATGLPEAFPDRESSEGALARSVVHVDRVDRLPREWYGYQGVDVLVLTTDNVEMCRQLAADRRRFTALEQWVELGGRLVVCCGVNSPKLLGEDGPLATLAPGKFAELIRLPETRGLDNFAESSAPIGRAGAELAIATPRLNDVLGRVDVFGRGSDLPIVVRTARGFGELAFVGLDLDRPPLAEWPGRNAFWRALLRPYVSSTESQTRPLRLTTLGYNDLSGALRQRLGRSFVSVTTISFSVVSALILAYLVLLGPLDYFLIHKLLRRPMLSWVSFPVIVLVTCCGAAGLTHWSKGTQAHVNQAELVDFDLSTGRARGAYWSTIYSPRAERFDLTLASRLPDGRPVESAESLLSWFGLAGSGLGGMHADGVVLDIARTGYQLAPQLNALEGVPVLTGSSKSVTARWTATAAAPCSADLSLDDDGLPIGTLKNESGALLIDACLLYGQWGYRLGDLEPGRQVEIGPELNPIRAKTLLARRVRQASAADSDGAAQSAFAPDQATTAELLETMMFYDALGGEGFAGLANRYQANCDLSRLLELGRAILVARGEGAGSQLVQGKPGKPLAGSDDPSTIVYRVVFPAPSKHQR